MALEWREAPGSLRADVHLYAGRIHYTPAAIRASSVSLIRWKLGLYHRRPFNNFIT